MACQRTTSRGNRPPAPASSYAERTIGLFLEGLNTAVAALPPVDHAGRLLAWANAAVNGYLDRYQLHDLVFPNLMLSNRRMKRANRAIANLQAQPGLGSWRTRA
jgi:hypothetical protein